MRNIIGIIAITLMCISGTAQSQQQKTVTQAEVINKITAATQKMKTMECDFVQTKHLKMLNDKMVSKGKMHYQQSDKLRWEYQTPYTYTFILNGTNIMMKKKNRTDVIDVNQNKAFKEIARIMMNSVVGNNLNNNRDFTTRMAQTQTEWIAYLTPKTGEMKMMFSQIVLHFDKKTDTITKVELIEKKGDKTIIELKNIKKNNPIDASTFAIK